MKVELGPVTGKNLNNLSEIINATFPVKYGPEFFVTLDRSHCQFAYVNDFLIGCIACRRSEISQNSMLYVLALATLAPYRRRGVASALLVWAETHARTLGCTEISLHVRASDDDARRFYLQRGFVERARVPNYYPLPENSEALLLAKPVDSLARKP
jgi:ribosomal protein S18 acetylase RimI-like enzyme